MAYATISNVAKISGKSEEDIEGYFLNFADREVERITGRSFGATAAKTEYFDVENRSEFFENDIGSMDFPLSCWPVTAITSVKFLYRNKTVNDQVQTTPIVLVADSDYYSENMNNACILKFADHLEFPIGRNVIEVIYTYGYASVPDNVKDFADYYAATLVEKNTSIPKDENGYPLMEFEMGRYRQRYANPNTVYEGKYAEVLKGLKEILEVKYKIWD